MALRFRRRRRRRWGFSPRTALIAGAVAVLALGAAIVWLGSVADNAPFERTTTQIPLPDAFKEPADAAP